MDTYRAPTEKAVEESYAAARERYAALGVDADQALERALAVPVSLHCWQADDGFTLSHRDDGMRDFWVRHGIASRRIAEYMGRELGTPCINNHWIPEMERV